MEHRRLIADPLVPRPFPGGDLTVHVDVGALVDELYARIESDPVLRGLFGRDLTREREAQKLFFAEWLGGEPRYSERAYLPLVHRHDLIPITAGLAHQWLSHFRHALELAVSDLDVRNAVFEQTRVLAMAMVNEDEPPSALRAHPHGTCLRYGPAVESLRLARRGEADALRSLLERSPDVLLSIPHTADLMRQAVFAGHLPVVEFLLSKGVDANKPAPVEPLIFLTPLCAARVKRRKDIEALLRHHGAEEDAFTDAYLGHVDRIEPGQPIDPAVDVLEITPVHHAIAGGQADALNALLSHVDGRLLGGARALRQAVERESEPMVEMLLRHGVDATSLGAGRWVLHPQLAPMLSRAGAKVDRSGSWIGMSCTGNQGRKDDPEFVAALLDHGARVDDKRLTGQGSDGGHATALHYAARAGFVKTIAVLLERGADPSAKDDNGRTPADWAARAAKSVDVQAVVALLRGR